MIDIRYKIIKTCADFIVDDNKTIEQYLFILKFLKSSEGMITIAEASNAIINVIKLALSAAINIKPNIIGKIWNIIAKGWSTETFSFAYASLLKKYVKYKAHPEIDNNIHSFTQKIQLGDSNSSIPVRNKTKIITICAQREKNVWKLFQTFLFCKASFDNTIHNAQNVAWRIHITIPIISI